MKRIPEPALMQDTEQVASYAQRALVPVYKSIACDLQSFIGEKRIDSLVDICCGPGSLTKSICDLLSPSVIHGVDGSAEMLKYASRNIPNAMLSQLVIDDSSESLGRFDLVFSSNALHHFHNPLFFWDFVKKNTHPGGMIFVCDLKRAQSEEEASELVSEFMSMHPLSLQRDFYYSLCAAFEPDEVEEQLKEAGLPLNIHVAEDGRIVVSGKFDY